jgi:methylisocitrate lyase
MVLTPGKKLRQLMQKHLVVAPGAYDSLSARLIESAGFEAVYISGSNVAAASLAAPDIGLLTMSEIAAVAENVVAAVEVPVICDADTGYGNAINVMRTVRVLERIGIAAIQLEDQVFPKRCGHFDKKQVISSEEMVQKLRAAQDAKKDPDFLIIARTDAESVKGFEEAIRRGQLYAKNGADIVFVEALKTLDQFSQIRELIPGSLMVNIVEGGKTPLLSNGDIESLGFQLAIWPASVMRGALYGIKRVLKVLMENGNTKSILTEMASWEERMQAVNLNDYQHLEKRYRVHEVDI